MLWLSELLMRNHQLQSFSQLIDLVQDEARGGELFFRMDVKPQFADTPLDWETRLEAAFTAVLDNQ